MNALRRRSTVWLVNFRDLPPPSTDGPPRALRALGLVAMATVVVSTFFTDPKPSLHGDGPLVIVGIVLLVGGLVLAVPAPRVVRQARASTGLALVGIATLMLRRRPARQRGLRGRLLRDGDRRHPARAATPRSSSAAAPSPGLVAIQLIEHENPAVIAGLLFSRAPVVLDHAADPPARRTREEAGEELRGVARRARRVGGAGRTRPRRARAARRARALAVRARPAARGHAPAGPRPRRRPRGHRGPRARAPPRGERADRGARRRSPRCAATTCPRSRTSPARSRTRRSPSPARRATRSSEARLALYRTAQEALTNVRRHSASDRVELRLDYEEDGTTLDRAGPRRPPRP